MKDTYPTLDSKQQRRELSYCARLCLIDVSKGHLQPSAVKSIRGHRVRPRYTRYLFCPRIQAKTLDAINLPTLMFSQGQGTKLTLTSDYPPWG